MLTPRVEYALRALTFLAQQFDSPQSAGQIAKQIRVPPAYLAKVLQELRRQKLVTSQRGITGGFRLAREIHQVTLYDVIQAVEPMPRIKECPLGLAAHGYRLCPLHRNLDETLARMERDYSRITLADLISSNKTPARTCPFPRLS